jgi:hypothetical protein
MCVSCGETPSNESDWTHCERCQCDFEIRPPQSYREMEGIQSLSAEPLNANRVWNEWREHMLIERWLWFFFGLGIFIVCLLMLF